MNQGKNLDNYPYFTQLMLISMFWFGVGDMLNMPIWCQIVLLFCCWQILWMVIHA